MGRFNSDNYKSADYAREIDQARSDLESDYPNARVFINFADGGSPSVRCKQISLVAPDGQANVVTHHLELPGKVWGKTFTNGYDIFVFSEGALEYGGKFGYVNRRLQYRYLESLADGIHQSRLDQSVGRCPGNRPT